MLVQVRLLKTKLGFLCFWLFLLCKRRLLPKNICLTYIYLYKYVMVLNQKRISLSDKETNLYHYIFKTLLNSNNLNSNPYQIRKRIYLYYYIFKTLLNNNNLNSNPYQIRKRIYIIIYLKPFIDYFLIQ